MLNWSISCGIMDNKFSIMSCYIVDLFAGDCSLNCHNSHPTQRALSLFSVPQSLWFLSYYSVISQQSAAIATRSTPLKYTLVSLFHVCCCFFHFYTNRIQLAPPRIQTKWLIQLNTKSHRRASNKSSISCLHLQLDYSVTLHSNIHDSLYMESTILCCW